MKSLFRLLIPILAPLSIHAADTGLDPSSVELRIYAVAVSESADCSNATAVATYEGGEVFDLMANPTIFSGAIANSTYPCVILQISDQVTFTPATTSTSGHCVAGTPVTTPICNADNHQKFQTMTVNSDNSVTFGAVADCTAQIGNEGEVVALFLSTASGSTHGVMAPFVQPSSDNAENCEGGEAAGCGIQLESPFVVTAETSGTFVVNFLGQVADGFSECGLEAPLFSFR